MTQVTLLLALVATVTLIRSTQAWTTFGNKAADMSLGKKSTALDVLTYLNRSNKLFPYYTPNEPSAPPDTCAVAVVTGGNAGIGAVSCKTLALAGMQVVLCARNVESARALVDTWPDHVSSRIDIQALDLANLTSVQEAAKSIRERYPEISILLNNAGVMAMPKKSLTAQGIELQFGTNHVGHHMWTRLLLPHLNDRGRIVTVASTAHTMASGKIQWQRPDYSAWREYGQSKLANILFAKRLQELLVQEGKTDIQSVSLHPGVISTSLWQHLPRFLQPLTRLIADKTVDQGAATSVYCCLADDVQGAAYYSDCKVKQPTRTAEDATMRKELWDYTEALIQEKGFELPKELVRDGVKSLQAEPTL
ncbi:short chain dehydrogenase [Fragilaria crotonensis]|nr:short chain dehydrogenase [Fragilaria crotonensis]